MIKKYMNQVLFFAYNRIEQQDGFGRIHVIRIIGFMMFWIAVGMIIGMLIQNIFWGIVIIILLMICGYNLFCCCK